MPTRGTARPRTVSIGPMPGGLEVVRPDVQLHVAEPVHAGDAGADRPDRHHGAGHLQHVQLDRRRAPSRASASGTPTARCAAAGANTSRPWNVCETGNNTTSPDLDLDRGLRPAERLPREGQQPVVGAHQERARRRAHRDGSPFRPHARIDDRDVDGVRRHVLRRASQGERAAHHVLARDVVGEVDRPATSGAIRSHHAVAHADELVGASRSRS